MQTKEGLLRTGGHPPSGTLAQLSSGRVGSKPTLTCVRTGQHNILFCGSTKPDLRYKMFLLTSAAL